MPTLVTLGSVQSIETRAYGNSNWLDQLTNINGTAITYDNMGNPLKWHNASSLTWEGRKLKTFTKTDGTVISYTYDENGIRTGKKIGSENVEYVLSGSKIIQEKRTNYTLTFLYDGSTLVGFNYKAGTTNADYYYGIDNFGNINYIYDSNGNIVVTYKYDAWGKAISTTGSLAGTIGAINPYRYKSYYFDSEIQMYYLQSRYYDAGVQRFMNEDEPLLLGTSGGVYSYNLYVYCENDPVNSSDPTGYVRFTNTINGDNVITKLYFWFTTITYKYTIKNGIISFAFANNDLWSVIWRGVVDDLAEAMYKAFKQMHGITMYGRTIRGLSVELQLHWLANLFGIKPSSSKEADMGPTRRVYDRYGKYLGFDSNAWFFETASTIESFCRYYIVFNTWSILDFVRDCRRYL